MKKIFLIAALIFFCAAVAAPEIMSKSEAELRSSMRTLWESRAILLRAYIISEMNDAKDTNEAKDKLLKNAGDLGDSIKPYYGGWASMFLAGFLKNDVRLTEKVIKAAKKGNKESPDLTEKAKEEALDLTKKAKEEALDLTKKAKEEALDLTKKDNKEAPALAEKGNKESPDLAEKAKEESLDLTMKANKESLDLTKKAKEAALVLAKGGNKESPYLTEKAKGKALGLTEKAKEKALDLTEKAKGKALDLTEKDSKEASGLTVKENKEALDLVKKAQEIALDLVKKAKEIAMDLVKKAKEIALDMTERANKEDLDRAKKNWYDNARSLAGFFAITHNQTKEDLTAMLYKHLDLTWGEIEAILTKDGAQDMYYYEKDRAHMIMFSDVLVDGLIKQFSNRFKE